MAKVKISALPFCGSPLPIGLIPFSQCGVTYSTYACGLGVMIPSTGCESTIRGGAGNSACGNYSFAVGCNNTVSGNYSSAFGCGLVASCNNTLYANNLCACNGVYGDFLQTSLTPTAVGAVGRFVWNNADGTMDLGLLGGNVTLQVGQETVTRVVNKTGANLLESEYKAVYISGAQGQRLKVGLAQANSGLTADTTIGLVTENITLNAEGFVTTLGLVRGINTTGSLQGETWLEGDTLYLSATVAGGLTNIEPVAPNHNVRIGYVVSSNSSVGSIYVDVQVGVNIGQLNDVNAATPSNNDILIYNSASCTWCNGAIPVTPSVMSAGTGLCSIKGSGFNNTASGDYSFVGGGSSNTASNRGSFVGSGQNNTAGGCFSVVVAGASNSASGYRSSVGGGGSNRALSTNATVSGGYSNCAVQSQSFVGGGRNNTASGYVATVVAGWSNSGSGYYSFIGGGKNNTATNNSVFIGGGMCNRADGYRSSISGGYKNTNNSFNGFIGGGQENTNSTYASCTSIVGGWRNQANCDFGTVLGGQCNLANACFAAVYGCNLTNSQACTFMSNNFVVGDFVGCGGCTLALDANGKMCVTSGGGGASVMNAGIGVCSIQGSGLFNSASGNYSFIGGGCCNTASGYYATISGGGDNIACNSYAFVGGGTMNQANGSRAVVVGGGGNNISGNNFTSVITGGSNNTISGYGSNGVIGGGAVNMLCGFGSNNTISGGYKNTISGCYSFIGGGKCNTVSGNYSGAFGCNLSATASCTFYVNDMCVCGTLYKTAGSFKIPHPDPVKKEDGKYLRHSFVESPTAGDNIYRFKVKTCNCSVSLELPDYYKFLNTNDQVWVSPVCHFGSAYGVVNESQNCVDVFSNADGEYNILVIGTRKDELAVNSWNGSETF